MFSPITPPESIEGNLALLEAMATQIDEPNEQTEGFIRKRLERIERAVLVLRGRAYEAANLRHTLITLRSAAVYQACLEAICDRLQVWPGRAFVTLISTQDIVEKVEIPWEGITLQEFASTWDNFIFRIKREDELISKVTGDTLLLPDDKLFFTCKYIGLVSPEEI